jgi:hypothetical protein
LAAKEGASTSNCGNLVPSARVNQGTKKGQGLRGAAKPIERGRKPRGPRLRGSKRDNLAA